MAAAGVDGNTLAVVSVHPRKPDKTRFSLGFSVQPVYVHVPCGWARRPLAETEGSPMEEEEIINL